MHFCHNHMTIFTTWPLHWFHLNLLISLTQLFAWSERALSYSPKLHQFDYIPFGKRTYITVSIILIFLFGLYRACSSYSEAISTWASTVQNFHTRRNWRSNKQLWSIKSDIRRIKRKGWKQRKILMFNTLQS